MPADTYARAATEPTVRLPVAVLGVVAALVAGLLAIWGATVVAADHLPSGPPHEPPVGQPAPASFSVKDQRSVRLEEFGVTLAGHPFGCEDPVQTPTTDVTQMVSCSAPVHEKFDGTNSWYATSGVVLLADSAVKPTLRETATAAFLALFSLSYSPADHTEVTHPDRDPIELSAPEGSTARLSARVEVTRKGLDTPYDTLTVVVVTLRSGAHVAFFSDVPSDADRRTVAAVATSLRTVTAQG